MSSNTCLKICPNEDELSSVCTEIKCPEADCSSYFKSSSNLNMHLIRHHKIVGDGLKRKNDAQYYCPAKSCPYFKDSAKYFTKLKYLKQHFLKVHATKSFQCNKCDKAFSTMGYLKAHVRNCGKEYSCNCGFSYTTSEALLTHCKRKGKGHFFVVQGKAEPPKSNPSVMKRSEANGKKTERLIYPKFSCDMPIPIHYIAAVALSELSAPCNLSKAVDKGVQTDSGEASYLKTHKTALPYQKLEKKRKSSQHTQTISKLKKLKISTQTQTNSDYLKTKLKQNLKHFPRKRKKSMETQTKDVKVKEISTNKTEHESLKNVSTCNSSTEAQFNMKVNYEEKAEEKGQFDKDKERKWLWSNHFFNSEKSSPILQGEDIIKSDLFCLSLHSKEPNLNDCNCLSEKTARTQFFTEQGPENQLFDLTKLCNIETQTEIDAFLTECNEDTTFTICSTTETQTTDDFDSLLYSNMCTQTCDDVDELFDFNFVHIETQTSWSDF